MKILTTFGLIAMIGGVVSLSGCETISKSDCEVGNWTDIGYKDGIRGLGRDKLADYVQACSKFGTSVDRTAYLAAYGNGLKHYCSFDNGVERGRLGKSYNTVCEGPESDDFRAGYSQGLRSYCNYDNGFERGRGGGNYNSVCQGRMAEPYRAGYDDGRAEYEIRKKYKRYVKDIDRKRAALEDVNRRLADKSLDTKERDRLIYKKKRLLKELRDLQWNLRAFKRRYDLDWGSRY